MLELGEDFAFANGFGAIEDLEGDFAIEAVAGMIDVAESAVAEFGDDFVLAPAGAGLEGCGWVASGFEGFGLAGGLVGGLIWVRVPPAGA